MISFNFGTNTQINVIYFFRSLCLHFKRPSAQYHSLRMLSHHESTWLDRSMEVVQEFQCGIQSSSEVRLNAICSPVQSGHDWSSSTIGLETLLLCINQHPIFSSNLTWLKAIDSGGCCPCSTELFDQICQAARSYLKAFLTRLQARQPVLCTWLTMERVLQAGFVWVIFLIYTVKSYTKTNYRTQSMHEIDYISLLEPLAWCNSILVFLIQRWKPGIPYHSAWEVVHTRTVHALLKICSGDSQPSTTYPTNGLH